jgi:ribosomal protein S18 acetylase RimI-like enzyme
VINSLVRPVDLSDHQQLSNLIFFETHIHRHLDWRSPLEWLGAPFYWALEEGRFITAALACPAEVPGIAWVRLFVYAGHRSADHAWTLLWSTAKEEIARAGGATVAAIAMQTWFQQSLAASGFENHQQIVMLEWQHQPWVSSGANEIRIRKMTDADLYQVVDTDNAAFDPLWHNSLDTIRLAFSQSLIGTVAENSQGIVGYQISTGHGQRAHLARLAVRPEVQGHGVGRALLSDLFNRVTQNGIARLSVNTQSDNAMSLSLYKKMGFQRTGEEYPVYTFKVPATS